MGSLNTSANEHEPSAYGERRFGFEKLWIVAIVLVAVGILLGLLWLANQSA